MTSALRAESPRVRRPPPKATAVARAQGAAIRSIEQLASPMDHLVAVHAVASGVPSTLVGQAAQRFGLPKERLAAIVGVSKPTLNRMERKAQNLDVVTGDVLKDTAQVLEKALRLLGGDRDAVSAWLREVVPALGHAPLDLLLYKDGRELVSNLLDRATSGAYA